MQDKFSEEWFERWQVEQILSPLTRILNSRISVSQNFFGCFLSKLIKITVPQFM